MAFIPKVLYSGTIPGTTGLLYTVPVGVIAEIRQVSMVNIGTTDARVTVYIVDSGVSEADKDIFMQKIEIRATATDNEHIDRSTWQPIAAGAKIYAKAIGSTVNIRISGAEETI